MSMTMCFTPLMLSPRCVHAESDEKNQGAQGSVRKIRRMKALRMLARE